VRRAQGLLWLAQGEEVSEVAKRLGVSRQMLYVLVERYEQRKKLPVDERLLDSEHSGRPAHKRELVRGELGRLLFQAPADYGYRGQCWTVGMLRKQIEQKHQMAISDDTVQRALTDLGYSCKRPRYVLARRDTQWRQAKGGFNKA
jgi:transposase